MAEFDLTQNPLENAESLLQQARQTSRRQRRDDTKNMLFNLAGQLVGGIMQGRQQEKYNNFINKESVLAERSAVQSAVDKAQRLAERGKAASSYQGGKQAYFKNELVELYKAQLGTRLGQDDKYYDQAAVNKLADQMASETLNDYIKGFDDQLGYAQNVINSTGGDRLAYGKALREASGVDLGVMGRGMRKLTSYFLDENDRNTDGAVYRSVTASEIYRTSKEFQENFDKYYTQTGSALVSDRVATWESDPKNKENLKKASLTSEIKRIDLGDGYGAIDRIVYTSPDGSFAAYRDIDESMRIGSPETAMGVRARPMGETMAADYLQKVISVVDKDTRADLNTMINNRTTGNTKIDSAFTKNLGNTLSFYEQGMQNSYDMSIIPEARLKSIVARAIAIDAKQHDNSLRLSKGNEAEGRITDNPILTYMAAVEEYGDVDDIPEEFRVQINRRIQEYVAQDLPGSASPARVEEAIDFVERMGGLGGGDFADFEIGKLPVLEAMELARAQATVRLQFKNQQLAGQIPEEMTFPEYVKANRDVQAQIQANLRKTARQQAQEELIESSPTDKTLMRGPY